MKRIPYIATDSTVSLSINNSHKVIKFLNADHKKNIIKLLESFNSLEDSDPNKNNIYEKLMQELQLIIKLKNKYDSRFYANSEGALFYEGYDRKIPDVLAARIIFHLENMLPVENLVKFWKNCCENPYEKTIANLYEFMERNNMPIDSDGFGIGYKKVYIVKKTAVDEESFKGYYVDSKNYIRNSKHQFVSKMERENFLKYIESINNDNNEIEMVDSFSKQVKYYIGKPTSIPIEECDFNNDVACSKGLHIGSFKYSLSFSGNAHIICKFNPADIVAIPEIYDASKIRAHTLTPIGFVEKEISNVYLK